MRSGMREFTATKPHIYLTPFGYWVCRLGKDQAANVRARKYVTQRNGSEARFLISRGKQ